MIFDFLIYYMTYWFENTSYKLAWNTPVERACYVVGLALTTFIWTIDQVLYYTVLKGRIAETSGIIIILLGICIIAMLQFVYVAKGRYNSISPARFGLFKKISEKNRSVLVVIFVVLSVVSSLFIFTLFVPFGINKLHHP